MNIINDLFDNTLKKEELQQNISNKKEDFKDYLENKKNSNNKFFKNILKNIK